jgi:hypothetical protein
MTREAPEISEAYRTWDREIAIRRIRVGCVLAMVVLPLGYFVDRHMYPAQVAEFLKYRFAGSAAMLPLLGFVLHPMGRRFHRVIGVVLAMIPAGCMAWIIRFTTDPAASPYYAGLNLVLLAVGLVLHWTTIQSASAVAGVILLYVTACAQAVHETNGGTFINNLYFIGLTGVIVIIGNSIQASLRRSDFVSRHRLEQSQKELEAANANLANLAHRDRPVFFVQHLHLQSLKGSAHRSQTQGMAWMLGIAVHVFGAHGDGHGRLTLAINLHKPRTKSGQGRFNIGHIHGATPVNDGFQSREQIVTWGLDQTLEHGGCGKHGDALPMSPQIKQLLRIKATGFRDHIASTAGQMGQ